MEHQTITDKEFAKIDREFARWSSVSGTGEVVDNEGLLEVLIDLGLYVNNPEQEAAINKCIQLLRGNKND